MNCLMLSGEEEHAEVKTLTGCRRCCMCCMITVTLFLCDGKEVCVTKQREGPAHQAVGGLNMMYAMNDIFHLLV